MSGLSEVNGTTYLCKAKPVLFCLMDTDYSVLRMIEPFMRSYTIIIIAQTLYAVIIALQIT